MITSTELSWMRATENQAMSSVATILSPSYSNTALGLQEESWTNAGTVACDIWPIAKNDREKSSSNQEISKGEFYISVPYNTDVSIEDKVVISDVIYDITFVPLAQSWLTNLRLEARNFNGKLYILTPSSTIPGNLFRWIWRNA